MKRSLTIAAALVFGLTVFTSCGSHNGTVIYPNSMSGTVGGVLAFSSSGSNITATKNNGTLNITATATNRSKITMSFPDFSATIGTRAINYIGVPVGATFDSLGNGHALLASTGSVTLSAVSPYLVGTFTFTCSDSTKITSGAFKIRTP